MALELQPDQNELAIELTRRCNIESRVDHVCGDFLDFDFGAHRFDAVVSWLALYHIPERPRHVRVLGEATVQALDDFYSAVDHHFYSGKLGGLRLCARRRDEP